ncbi:MAG TPA: 3-oxoacyl-ACP synthase III [Bacteriovoracaceae bacterium]|nr:3-oxoacyl-ACP synthase III [Bacteriovoracaceae bacterium]
MKLNNVVLHSWGIAEPHQFVTSDEIELELKELYERARLPFGRLELQTGIKSRGVWPVGTRPSTIASMAAKEALKDFPLEDVDLLLHASVCRDFLEPATAAQVHFNLGLKPECMIGDLSNACLGVLSSILMAGQMIDSGAIKSALIVSGENSGPLLEETLKVLKTDHSIDRKKIKPFIANLTIGSAGVAFLLTHEKMSPQSPKILGGSTLTDSSSVELCQGDGSTSGLMMQTDSEALLVAGIKLSKDNWQRTKEVLGWENEDVDKIIPHQVGSAHRFALLNELSLPLDRDFQTFPTYGNTGSAALPLTFIKAERAGFFKANDKIAFLGIGSGLTSTMLGVQWR